MAESKVDKAVEGMREAAKAMGATAVEIDATAIGGGVATIEATEAAGTEVSARDRIVDVSLVRTRAVSAMMGFRELAKRAKSLVEGLDVKERAAAGVLLGGQQTMLFSDPDEAHLISADAAAASALAAADAAYEAWPKEG